jgi:DNA-binding helix-hairpin-helix protein with protein kinase domain
MEGWQPFIGTPPPSYADNISVENNIMQGIFPYDERVQADKRWRPPRYAPPYEVVGPELKELFYRTFVESAHEPTLRPSAYDFRMALERLENHLQVCAYNPHHVYPRSLSTCPWCEHERALQLLTTPLPAQAPITASPPSQPVQQPFSSQPAISSVPYPSLSTTSMTPSPRPSATSLSTRRLTYFILLFLIGIAATYFMFLGGHLTLLTSPMNGPPRLPLPPLCQ